MAIVDSSVLIHLSRIGRLYLLKKFFKRIAITNDIYEEIKKGKIGTSEIENAYREWIRILSPKNLNEATKISELEGIEKADASIILLAKENKEILLSNDYALIMVAKSKGIKCWWLTTFLLKSLKKRIIIKKEAKGILNELIDAGMRLDNAVYVAIINEIDKKW